MTQPDGPTAYPANWPGARPQGSESPSVAVELAIESYLAALDDNALQQLFNARVAEVCTDMLNTTAASMQSARQLIAAVKDLGITPPKPLNDIIAGFDVLATHAAQPDPAQTIIDAAADGELTAEHLDELINEAATAQLPTSTEDRCANAWRASSSNGSTKRCVTGPPMRSWTACGPTSTPPHKHSTLRQRPSTSTSTRASSPNTAPRRTGSVAQHPTRRADAGRHLDNGPPVRPPLNGLGCPETCRKASTRAASPTKP